MHRCVKTFVISLFFSKILDATFTYTAWDLDWNVVFPLRTINFEGQDYPCPNNPDKYLTALYGDWKTPNNRTDRETEPHTTTSAKPLTSKDTEPDVASILNETARLKHTELDTDKIHNTDPDRDAESYTEKNTEPGMANDRKPGTAKIPKTTISNRDVKADRTKYMEPGTGKKANRVKVRSKKTNKVKVRKRANLDRDMKPNIAQSASISCMIIVFITFMYTGIF